MKSLNLLTKRVSLASFLILQIILGGNLSAEGIEYKPAGTPKRIVITDKGDKIAVIEGDRTISVYSTKSNKKISRFRNTSDIDDLTFSPNGYHLMTGDEDNTRKIWNVNSGKLLSTLKGQRGDVNAVDYSPNGKLAAASSDDSSIRIWDPIASKVIRTLKTKERPKDIRFFGNNRDIIISTYNGFQIRNAHTAKLLATFGSKPGYKRFTVNRAGTIVLGIPEGRMDEYVEAWDIKSKKKLFTLKGHKYQVDKVIFSKDEKSFVTVSHDDKIKVWNAEDGTEIHSIENKNGSLHVLALDGNPSRIWVGDSKSVKLIDLPGIDAKMRANFASQAKSAKTSELAFSVYQTYKNKLIFPGDKSALNDLLKYAYKIERDAAVASDSSKSMYAIYSKYNKEFVTKEDRADHLELYHAAMKSHFNGTLATKSVEKMVGIYKTYAGMNHTGKTNELVKGFLKDAIDWSLSQPDLTQDTKLTVFNHWVEVIVLNHSELTVDLLKNVTKIDLRHVFKEGKIGERYVPTLSHGTSSTKTRYINGNAINETTYDSYTTGGYDESRYGYTSVYQMFNESEEYYLIDLEVNATSSFTNYKTGKSWGGDEYKTKQSKENRISQKTQYLIRPKTQVKDQLIVGEKIPADFYLKVSKIQKLDKKWVDGLDSALEGNNLKLTQQYMADKSARNWLPQLGSVFAGQAFRELKHSIKVGDRFDKDFASTVIVTFENANSVAVEVGYQPNFSEKIQKMVIQPKSSVNQNVLAKGQSQSNLSLELLMIEPTK